MKPTDDSSNGGLSAGGSTPLRSRSPTLSVSSAQIAENYISNLKSTRPPSLSETKNDDHDRIDDEKAIPTVAAAAEVPNSPPPDSGRAWIVAFGSFCMTFATFGYINAWGVFQSYYQDTILKGVSPSTISWIGSVQYLLILAPGIFAGRLFDIGFLRIPLFISSLVLVLATILVAECTKFWHFLLCQGFAGGLACGFMFGPALSVLGHWFQQKRGLAIGVAASGSAIGGTVLPIAIRRLIPLVGFKWSLRIVALILLFVLGLSNLAIRRRLPPKKVQGGVFGFRAFKNIPFSFYCASGFIAFVGMYTVLTYIDVAGANVGLDPDFSFYLVSIANGSSIIGRLASGKISDMGGALNTLIPFTLVAGVMTYAWPFATDKGSLVAVAVIYGISSGAFVSLAAMPAMSFGEIHDVGRRTGMLFTICGLGALIGPPISGAIYSHFGQFNEVGFFAGSAVTAATVLMVCSRQAAVGGLRGKV